MSSPLPYARLLGAISHHRPDNSPVCAISARFASDSPLKEAGFEISL
jgi:hypothetical protein